MDQRRSAWAVALLAGLIMSAGCNGGTPGGRGAGAAAASAVPVSYHGVEPDPAPSRPQFVLHDTAGRVFDFLAQTRGRPTYLYFGYTHCPDACPTAMADVASALRHSSGQLRQQTRVVFVTTDAARDSGPVVRRWLDQFSPSFVGLTGTQSELDAAARASGVEPGAVGPVTPTLPGHPDQHVHQPGTAPHQHFGPLGYSVAHSAVIYAFDVADRLPVVYPGGSTPSDIAADLPVLARH